MTWQPIDTAPRDGTAIILGYYDKRDKMAARSAFWMLLNEIYGNRKYDGDEGLWVCNFDTRVIDQRATHWMPLIVPEIV